MDKDRKIAQLIIARLDGRDICRKFNYYLSLVEKGIGGFIIFGGMLKEVRDGIRKLQRKSDIPLFISSDLERGLGQQIEGGTIFPPAMAFAEAVNQKKREDLRLLRRAVEVIALEAKAAGINIIFAPVMDVNTNPQNPIICTRAFSDDPRKVSWYGREFIRGIQRHGLIACAKHFPGHGDTAKDSHRELPVVNADMRRLNKVELYPFKHAIDAGVGMIMMGHLKVPVIDKRFPASLSDKAIKELLRDRMGFKGLVITDAMNMHAVSRSKGKAEGESCMKALSAGVDILLHPEKPEEEIDYLASRWDSIKPEAEIALKKILKAKKRLERAFSSSISIRSIGKKENQRIAYEITEKSITSSLAGFAKEGKRGTCLLSGRFKEPVILIIDDDDAGSGRPFIRAFKERFKKTKTLYVDNKKSNNKKIITSVADKTFIAIVFSRVSAWKGRGGLSRELKTLLKQAVKASKYSIVAGFCSPYILRDISADQIIEAYSDSEQAQEITANIIVGPKD